MRKLSGSQLQLDFWPFCLNLQKQFMARHELKDGISHINRTALLRASIHFSSISFFILFLYDGLFIFIFQKLGFEEGSCGVFISAVGMEALSALS